MQYSKWCESKEKYKTSDLLKKISTLEFLLSLIIWEKILTAINLASRDLQAFDIRILANYPPNWEEHKKKKWSEANGERFKKILALSLDFLFLLLKKEEEGFPDTLTKRPQTSLSLMQKQISCGSVLSNNWYYYFKARRTFQRPAICCQNFQFSVSEDFIEIYQFDMRSKSEQPQDYCKVKKFCLIQSMFSGERCRNGRWQDNKKYMFS